MVRAIRGMYWLCYRLGGKGHLLICFPGVLIECEPAIKSIIVHLDSINHDFIIEDLDDHHLVVKENMVQVLKQKLEDVSLHLPIMSSRFVWLLMILQRLRETYRPEEPLADSD